MKYFIGYSIRLNSTFKCRIGNAYNRYSQLCRDAKLNVIEFLKAENVIMN